MLQRFLKLVNWAAERRRPLPLEESMEGLSRWQETPLARAIRTRQKQQLDTVLKDSFGYHLLEISCAGSRSSMIDCRINHCFRLCPCDGYGANALSELERLPFEDESIDVAVLHHTLDFSSQPHQVLREINRVLISRGTLIIIGFNPFSLQGLWRGINQWFSRNSFWRRHSLRVGRVMDWLQLLDCETVDVLRGFYRPPINSENILSGLSFFESVGEKLRLPWSGYYIVVARKERMLVRPIRPVWNRFNPVEGLIAKPTPRLPRAVGQRQQHMSDRRQPIAAVPQSCQQRQNAPRANLESAS